MQSFIRRSVVAGLIFSWLLSLSVVFAADAGDTISIGNYQLVSKTR